jgi:large subunit ribosomal protein L5
MSFQTYATVFFPRDLLLKTSCRSLFDLPRVSKIVLHTSSKKILTHPNHLLQSLLSLQLLCGQKAKKTRARKSIAGFKTRKGNLLGGRVTLRGKKMYQFLDHLVLSFLPRFLDAQGSNAMQRLQAMTLLDTRSDSKGNMSFGFNKLLLSPSLEDQYDFFESLDGFQMTFVFSHPTRPFCVKHKNMSPLKAILDLDLDVITSNEDVNTSKHVHTSKRASGLWSRSNPKKGGLLLSGFQIPYPLG